MSTEHSLNSLRSHMIFVNFCRIYVHPLDLPSTFCASQNRLSTSVNIFCVRGTFQKRFVQPRLFHQLSVQSWDLPSAFHAFMGPSINFLYVRGTFHELPSTFRAFEGLSVNFPDNCRTFHQLPSTFRASSGNTVKFRERIVRPRKHP